MEKYSEFEYKKVVEILSKFQGQISRLAENFPEKHGMIMLGIHDIFEDFILTWEGIFDFQYDDSKEGTLETGKAADPQYIQNKMPILQADFINQDEMPIFSFFMYQSHCLCKTLISRKDQDSSIPPLLLTEDSTNSTWEYVLADFIAKVQMAINEAPDFSYENLRND